MTVEITLKNEKKWIVNTDSVADAITYIARKTNLSRYKITPHIVDWVVRKPKKCKKQPINIASDEMTYEELIEPWMV